MLNWRQQLTLICLTLIAGRGLEKWFGEDVVTAMIGVGLAVLIASRVRDYVRSKRSRGQPANR